MRGWSELVTVGRQVSSDQVYLNSSLDETPMRCGLLMSEVVTRHSRLKANSIIWWLRRKRLR
jgi:hypothetical protein